MLYGNGFKIESRLMVDRYTYKHDLRIYLKSLQLQVKSALSLKGAFIIQVAGMMINNFAIIIAWLFLFNKFGSINGWRAQELIGVEGINMLIFGIMMILSGGIMNLPRLVDRGALDGMLTKPEPILLQLSTSSLDVSCFGDAILGLILTSWYIYISPNLSIIKIGLFLLAIIIGLVLFWCFAILLPNILAFYLFNAERLSRHLGSLFLDTGIYPTGILTGALRSFMLLIIPGLYIGAVPLDILYKFDWSTAVMGILVAIGWLIVTLWLFKRAIKRYESSNLFGAR